MGYPDFTEFTVPVRRDANGGIETRQVLVSNDMLPIMADIIAAATSPYRLHQEYRVDMRGAHIPWESLRDRIQYDLEHGLREDAKKKGIAVITEVTFGEAGDALGVLFTADATGMPLLQKGIQR